MAEELNTKAAGQAVPEGWKLVPVEPTEAMKEAVERAQYGYHEGPVDGEEAGWIYSDMLAAAPSPAAREAGDGVSDSESLHTFLDAAAGEGLVLNGIDAADLYIRLFPERYAATLSAHPAKD